MRIDVYTVRVTGRGGMEQVMRTVIAGLIARGHEVRLIREAPGADEAWIEGLPVTDLAGENPRLGTIDGLFEQEMALAAFYRQSGLPDVVVPTASAQVVTARVVLSAFGKQPRVLPWVHFTLSRVFRPDWLQWGDAFIALGPGQEREYRERWPDKPVFVIPNPAAVRVQPIPRPQDGVFRLVYAGRLVPQKRLDLLLGALATIPSRNWELLVAGDGPERGHLQERAQQLAISDQVRWRDWSADPWAGFPSASLAVLTSEWEGFPVMVGEALARGIPALATDCPVGPADLITNGVNGFLVPCGNTSALRKVLQNLMSGEVPLPDPEACRASVKALDVDLILDRWEQVLGQFT